LPSERQHFDRAVVGIDVAERRLRFADGGEDTYDHLISTMPLDLLLRMLDGQLEAARLADAFVHSSTHIVGIGVDGQPPADLRGKCWIYFPESGQPFYRATVFSNYSPNNVARPGEQWSLMAEVSETEARTVDGDRIVDDVVDAMVDCGFVERDRIVSRWHRRLEHGYPTPWLGRDSVLAQADGGLRDVGIFSRGRFGAWKYEASNQDHSLMQGVEAVDHILRGSGEVTYDAS
jgi:protoporphyrinogen oxidase